MTELGGSGLPPEVRAILDDDPAAGYACQICGALVARTDHHAQAHWEWHQAIDGV